MKQKDHKNHNLQDWLVTVCILAFGLPDPAVIGY
jgi:hypothetical protein